MQLQWELQAVPRVGEITGTSGKGPWPGINPLSEKGDGELPASLAGGGQSPGDSIEPKKTRRGPQTGLKCKGHKEHEGNGVHRP